MRAEVKCTSILNEKLLKYFYVNSNILIKCINMFQYISKCVLTVKTFNIQFYKL